MFHHLTLPGVPALVHEKRVSRGSPAHEMTDDPRLPVTREVAGQAKAKRLLHEC